MATPYKMKGSPMQRNFGISPMREGTRFIDKVKAGVKGFVAGASEVSGGFDTAQATYIKEKQKYRKIQSDKKKK